LKVHLVDGTYELFRAYYGVPPHKDREGMEVGACVGLARSLLFLLKDPEVTHVACAFDQIIESFRNEMFDGYKTSEGIEPALWAQFGLAEEVCRAIGLVTWPMIEFEADDALATAAERFRQLDSVKQVVIASPDKDLTQCVEGKRVVSWDRRRKLFFDQEAVRLKFGVEPESIPDYLGLVGDTADGIPGIAGWGAKSTAIVLSEYGHIEAIPESLAQWRVKPRGAQRLVDNLNKDRQAALLYRRLATLRRDVPLDQELEDLRWLGADRDHMKSLCHRLDEPELIDQVRRFR